METKFTKGPWKRCSNKDRVILHQGVSHVTFVEIYSNHLGDDDKGADTSLIAAAPCLYEALEEALLNFDEPMNFNMTAWRERAQAALQKARGL